MIDEGNSINKDILRVDDLVAILGIGRNTAYNLMRSKDFPSKQIGRQWFISTNSFEYWLGNNFKD